MIDDEEIVLTDEETEVEAVDTVEAEVETVETEDAPAYDLRSREQEIREDERRRVQDELAQAQQRQATQSDEQAELEKIAELATSLNPADNVEAERRRVALAERRMEAKYGRQLLSSGVSMAVTDARTKFKDDPPEMLPYIESVIVEAGLQNEVPANLMKSIRQLAYGAAALEGKLPTGKPAPKVIATTGAERGTATISTIPAAVQQDASEFEKYFGKAALNVALKEAELA